MASQYLATAGQSLLQSCRSPSPADLSCLYSGHFTVMWHKVVRMPGVKEGKSGLEPANASVRLG